ncbi:sensor histidine kinase, partial [Clostridium botulinum D/C]|nr:sensor histidine kinase [Clostridium botulinum D/C]
MKSLYNNPEVKSITTKFLIMSLVVMIFLFIFMKIEINNFKNLYIEQNTALAGKILSKHPSLKDDLIPIFTKGASKEEISIGKLTLSKYNLNNYKDYIYEKPMDTYYKS